MKHDYHGKPASLSARLMRVAMRYKKEERPEKAAELEALAKKELGENEKKRLPEFIAPGDVTCFCVDGKNVLWIGTNEGLWRVDESEKDELDRVQCFRANACMFDNNVKAVEPDGKDGVWVLTETGVSHIEMRMLSVEHKANLHSAMDERIVQRRGMLSNATWDADKNKWVPHESDNDGLWTALVAMGDICRYGVMKNDPKYTPEQVEHARKVATRWTEAVLLLEYIPSWKGKVAAFVRYNEPGTNRASKGYLKRGREGKLNIPDVGPTGFIHAELGPVDEDDWAERDAVPEIVFRNVEGYIARSYHVTDPVNDPIPFHDGVFFKKVYDPDGKLVSVRVPTSSDKGDDLPGLLTVEDRKSVV